MHDTPMKQPHPALAAEPPLALDAYLRRFALRRFTDPNGASWTYRDTLGGGPVVIFLPGAAGGGESAFKLVQGLEDGFRCVSVTYPGGETAASLVQGLCALMDHLELSSAAVWGSSYGAWWAQELARQHPERISHLWLGNTLSARTDVAQHPLFAQELLHANTAEDIQATWLNAVFSQPESELRSLQLYFIAHSLSADNLKGRLQQVTQAELLAPALGVQRTAVFSCEDDPIIGAAARQRVADLYPHASVLQLAKGGHYPHLTQVDALLPLLRQWLQGG